MGPGSLYTSILPNLVIKGMGEAIAASSAYKIYVCNVMTQQGKQTWVFRIRSPAGSCWSIPTLRLVDACLINDAVISNEEAPEPLP